jgi:hypothetical protein
MYSDHIVQDSFFFFFLQVNGTCSSEITAENMIKLFIKKTKKTKPPKGLELIMEKCSSNKSSKLKKMLKKKPTA